MKKTHFAAIVVLAVSSVLILSRLDSAEKSAERVVLLKVNRSYDKRTVIKKSTIPNAGNGLFVLKKIRKDDVIGELGGRLLTEEQYPAGNHYIASIAECAWKEAYPYRYIDSREHGAHVSRINFAPSEINGIETHFQNAKTRQLCKSPYFIFVAVRDIAPGEEIWSTYGPNYEYDRFMKSPQVRDFFCGRLKIDCRQKYTYSP